MENNIFSGSGDEEVNIWGGGGIIIPIILPMKEQNPNSIAKNIKIQTGGKKERKKYIF